MRVAYPSVGKAFRSVQLAWCSYLAVYSALPENAVSTRSLVLAVVISSSYSSSCIFDTKSAKEKSTLVKGSP
jgi:hypothetical protein